MKYMNTSTKQQIFQLKGFQYNGNKASNPIIFHIMFSIVKSCTKIIIMVSQLVCTEGRYICF